MKRIFTACCLLFSSFASQAQTHFEALPIDTALHYWKGVPGVAGFTPFQSGNAQFINRNDTSSFGDYWSGWAYSAETDTVSISYADNDCAAITGKGNNNSAQYGVAYVGFDPTLNAITFPGAIKPISMKVTNTTIAYRSMQNGDFVAKKFGGTTGNDPDFFRLDIMGWLQGMPSAADTIHVYLADFRDTNNANDYIVNTWKNVDLTPLGNQVDSISYWMVSSDTSSFGINTPTYFCMDDLSVMMESVNDVEPCQWITAYPNPANDRLCLQNVSSQTISVQVFDIRGQLVYTHKLLPQSHTRINTSSWPSAYYSIRCTQNQSVQTIPCMVSHHE
jgi:hypothetical protein